MPVRIEKYEQAFDLISVSLSEKARFIIGRLEKDGHSEKSICFSVWKSQKKLIQFKRDSRFWAIFMNEVKKWSWPKGDLRWKDYWKRKEEEKKAAAIAKEAEKKRVQEMAYKKRYPGFVYFIQGESGGPIKIGYTQDIKSRLTSLQTGCPETLKLLLAIPGKIADEQKIHAELDPYRMRGEWFSPSDGVLEKMRCLQ